MNKAVLSQRTLKYTYGAVVLLVGLDKVLQTHLIVNWNAYVSSFVANLLPFSVGTFMIIVGIIEVAVGIMLFTRHTRIFAYIASVWLILISINLLILGSVDIALRDIGLAVGALVLAWLTEFPSDQGVQ